MNEGIHLLANQYRISLTYGITVLLFFFLVQQNEFAIFCEFRYNMKIRPLHSLEETNYGIFGYVGTNKNGPRIVLAGLKQLEYRGTIAGELPLLRNRSKNKGNKSQIKT